MDSGDIDDSKEARCVICVTGKPNGILYPCRHTICSDPKCHNALNKPGGVRLCCFCRTPVQDIVIPVNADDWVPVVPTAAPSQHAPVDMSKEVAPVARLHAITSEELGKPSITISLEKSLLTHEDVLNNDNKLHIRGLLSVEAPPPAETAKRAYQDHGAEVDMIALLDISGSMSNDMESLRMAVTSFTRRLKATDRLSVVTFDSDVYINCNFLPMTEHYADAVRRLKIENNGMGTRMAAGLRKVADMLNSRAFGRDRQTVVVVLSDGVTSDQTDAIWEKGLRHFLDQDVSERTKLFSYGFRDADSNVMRGLAQKAEGQFFFMKNAQVLEQDVGAALDANLGISFRDLNVKMAFKSFEGDGPPTSVQFAETTEERSKDAVKFSVLAGSGRNDFVFTADVDFNNSHRLRLSPKKPEVSLFNTVLKASCEKNEALFQVVHLCNGASYERKVEVLQELSQSDLTSMASILDVNQNEFKRSMFQRKMTRKGSFTGVGRRSYASRINGKKEGAKILANLLQAHENVSCREIASHESTEEMDFSFEAKLEYTCNLPEGSTHTIGTSNCLKLVSPSEACSCASLTDEALTVKEHWLVYNTREFLSQFENAQRNLKTSYHTEVFYDVEVADLTKYTNAQKCLNTHLQKQMPKFKAAFDFTSNESPNITHVIFSVGEHSTPPLAIDDDSIFSKGNVDGIAAFVGNEAVKVAVGKQLATGCRQNCGTFLEKAVKVCYKFPTAEKVELEELIIKAQRWLSEDLQNSPADLPNRQGVKESMALVMAALKDVRQEEAKCERRETMMRRSYGRTSLQPRRCSQSFQVRDSLSVSYSSSISMRSPSMTYSEMMSNSCLFD